MYLIWFWLNHRNIESCLLMNQAFDPSSAILLSLIGSDLSKECFRQEFFLCHTWRCCGLNLVPDPVNNSIKAYIILARHFENVFGTVSTEGVSTLWPWIWWLSCNKGFFVKCTMTFALWVFFVFCYRLNPFHKTKMDLKLEWNWRAWILNIHLYFVSFLLLRYLHVFVMWPDSIWRFTSFLL